MQAAGDAWWCPRCGTLKTNNRSDALGTYEPRLIERVVCLLEGIDDPDDDITVERLAVEECLGDVHSRDSDRDVEAGKRGTDSAVDQS